MKFRYIFYELISLCKQRIFDSIVKFVSIVKFDRQKIYIAPTDISQRMQARESTLTKLISDLN